MRRVVLVAVALAALVAPSSALTATTPTAAAVKAARCLRAHGWAVRLSDRGVTVNAHTQRRLTTWPWHPRAAWSFYRDGARIRHSYFRQGLNAAETRIGAGCLRVALR